MEAAAMKVIIFLAFIGSGWGALVPLTMSPGFYSNFISSHRTEIPIQRLDGPALGAYSPQQYLVYDLPQVNTAVRTYPTAVFSNGRPAIAHIPTTYNYYGTPVYDFRFPYNPISPPGLIPSTPGYIPRPAIPQPIPQPIPPNKPADADDGIEKLDEKVEPGYDPLGEAAGAANSGEVSYENDSISVEAA